MQFPDLTVNRKKQSAEGFTEGMKVPNMNQVLNGYEMMIVLGDSRLIEWGLSHWRESQYKARLFAQSGF